VVHQIILQRPTSTRWWAILDRKRQ
jgi:hypothetical protein